MKVTPAMKKAITWLNARGNSGVVNNRGRLVAAGEVVNFAPETWLRLAAGGYIEGHDGYLIITGKGEGLLS